MVIEWTLMPTYNTIMAMCAGAALCSIAYVGKNLFYKTNINPEGWSLNFFVLGLILFLTGLHMSLTWPFAKYFPFDNVIFGEPSLGFGALLLVFSFYFWKRANIIENSENPLQLVSKIGQSFKFIMFGFGLMLVFIGIAGVTYKLFAAPSEEPISGLFSNYPWFEAIFLSTLFSLVGIVCFLMPFLFKTFEAEGKVPTSFQKNIYCLLYLTGVILLLFGAMNYFTHIGLIIHTMGS